MNTESKENTVTLQILAAIEERSDLTQRHLAQRTGVALGLAHSYVKRCVRKGLVKVTQVPSNRYLYYLTPKGFAEKSRLTGEYLRYSLQFYREAAHSFAELFEPCERAGQVCIALYGASELAEIAMLRALERRLQVVAVCDPADPREQFVNVPLLHSIAECPQADIWVLTEQSTPEAALRCMRDALPIEQIRVPTVLNILAPQ